MTRLARRPNERDIRRPHASARTLPLESLPRVRPHELHEVLANAGDTTRAAMVHSLQRAGGNAQVARTIGRSSDRQIQRQGTSAPRMEDLNLDVFRAWTDGPESDTYEIEWPFLVETHYLQLEAAAPAKFAMPPSHAPAPPDERKGFPRSSAVQYCPPHHKDPQTNRQLSLIHDWTLAQREQYFTTFREDTMLAERGWNAAVPLIASYNDAQNDPSLHEADAGLQVLAKQGHVDLSELAEGQRAPLKGGKSTVGELFKPTMTIGEGPHSITVRGSEPTGLKSEERAVGRAAASPAVDDHVKLVATAEHNVEAAVHDVAAKAKWVEKYGKDVEVANDEIDLEKAKEAKAGKEAALADIQAAKARTKELVGQILNIAVSVGQLAVGLPAAGVGGATPAATGTLRASVGGNVEPISATAGGVGIFANWIIDEVYADDLQKAERELANAVQLVRDLTGAVLAARLSSAQKALAASQEDLKSSAEKLKSALIERRRQYDLLALAAAKAGGGSRKTQGELAAMIAGIPIAELVITRTTEIQTQLAAAFPAYTSASGRGFRMAEVHGYHHQAYAFLEYLGYVQGLSELFTDVRDTWTKRLNVMRGVVTKLGALGGTQ